MAAFGRKWRFVNGLHVGVDVQEGLTTGLSGLGEGAGYKGAIGPPLTANQEPGLVPGFFVPDNFVFHVRFKGMPELGNR